MPLLSETNRRKRNLLVILAFLALVGGLSAVDLGSFAPELPVASNIVIFALFNLNLVVFLLLLMLLVRNLVKLGFERRQKVIGARFKAKLVLAFLSLSVAPAILIFIIASNFINKSIEGWFKPQVERPLDQALSVAQTYYANLERTTLRHGQRLVERALDLRLEPALDRLVDEVRRDDEDQDGRRQRQRQEGQDQLRLELGPDQLLAALEPQLDQVADEQHQQQQEHDEVQVEEREDDDVGGERDLGHPHLEVDGGGGGGEDEQRPDDEEVAAASALLGQ